MKTAKWQRLCARLEVVVRRYEGERQVETQAQTVAATAEAQVFEVGAGKLSVRVEAQAAEAGTALRCEWRVESGTIAECAVGVRMTFGEWDTGNFVWMAGAVYAGNRFTVRPQGYSPRYPEADAGPQAKTVITDIPRLSEGAGCSRVQLLSGDMSAPAMGFVDAARRRGCYLATETVAPTDLLEVAEADDRSSASFTALRGGVREGRYAFRVMKTGQPSGDRAPTLHAGDCIEQRLWVCALEEADIPQIFEVHFDWMLRAPLPRLRTAGAGVTLAEAAALIEAKYNRENWDERNELYATTCDAGSPHYYQTGWCGGGIADSALLRGQEPLSRRRAERALNRLCREGQLPSGFFYGKRRRDGAWAHDFAHDVARPYTHTWSLVRRSGDLLFYLLRAAQRPGLEAEPSSVALWLRSARKLADALCLLWEREGQLGQFIDAEAGVVRVGGSASGGVVPAGLAAAARAFGEARYLECALQIARDYHQRFTLAGYSTGGPADACQAPDSESCAGLLESYVSLYEASGEAFWLEAARQQAAQLASWVMPYDYAFPPESEFGKLGIPTTGSVFANAQNKHSAPGICTHSGTALWRLSQHTGDRRYARLFHWIADFLPWAVSRDAQPIHDPSGNAMPSGWMNERVNTSDWDDNVGGIFHGSCWCEVSLLLTAVEAPQMQ